MRRYAHTFKREGFVRMLALAFAAFVASWFVNYYAIVFSTAYASNKVADLILSNVPVFHVADLFVYGTFVCAAIAALILIAHPKRLPFALFAIALFWFIRSGFVLLTHIAPFESSVASDFGPAIVAMFFGGDLFFSAHTGMPFLGALLFWRERGIRNFYLLSAAFFACVVLLGHLHYSIDVASAFFITYSIYHLALTLFPKSRDLFYGDEPLIS